MTRHFDYTPNLRRVCYNDYGQTWRHPQNRKYLTVILNNNNIRQWKLTAAADQLTYCNASRGRPSHGCIGCGHRLVVAIDAEKLWWRLDVKFCSFWAARERDRQTDRRGHCNSCVLEYRTVKTWVMTASVVVAVLTSLHPQCCCRRSLHAVVRPSSTFYCVSWELFICRADRPAGGCQTNRTVDSQH